MSEGAVTRQPSYDAVAKTLHWLVVALLVLQFLLGWTMPDIHRGTKPEGLISLHLSFGLLILFIVILRFLWRLTHPVPLLSGDDVPLWQVRAAKATHELLYLLLFLLPLMGWANASSRGWTAHFFGLFTLPALVSSGSAFGHELGDVHIFTSYVLLGLIGIHVAASLYHHFWLGDRVLVRMIPGRD